MNKLFTTVIFCFFISFISNAQVSKGNWLLGGGVGMGGSGSTNNDSFYSSSIKQIDIYLSPTAGVFITNRWVVGLSPSWNYNRQEHTNTGQQPYSITSRGNIYGVSLFTRYYVPFSEKWYGFFNLRPVAHSRGRTTITTTRMEGQSDIGNITRSNISSIGASVALGATYLITPKVGVEASVGSIGYNFSRTKNEIESQSEPTRETTVKANGGGLSLYPLNLTFGLQFYLGKNQE